jgi:transcription initiation factor IIE alpha subunit
MSNYVRDLPEELIRLVRYVLRSFYDFELYLVMDMLIHYPCIKEDQLADILKLDGKIVRQYLIALKAEKFVSEKLAIETTTADNKQNKVLHYYINYKMMVNVVKFKLDNMRKQIESEEKQLTCRASYKCLNCGRHYTDLDMVDIFMTMRCITCDEGRVDEDVSSLPKAQSRNLLANFNTQTKPIFDLLQKVEYLELKPHILSPSPADYSCVIDGTGTRSSAIHQSVINSITMSNHKWSGDKTRELISQTPISITISSNEQEMTLNDRIKSSIALNASLNTSADLTDSITPNNSLSAILDKSKFNKTYSAPVLDNQQVPTIQSTNNKSLSKSLEEIIMDILIVYENKSMNKKLNGLNNNGLNNIENNINNGNKKRDFNQTSDDLADSILNELNNNHNNHSDDDDINNNISKKRKLNGNFIKFIINLLCRNEFFLQKFSLIFKITS